MNENNVANTGIHNNIHTTSLPRREDLVAWTSKQRPKLTSKSVTNITCGGRD